MSTNAAAAPQPPQAASWVTSVPGVRWTSWSQLRSSAGSAAVGPDMNRSAGILHVGHRRAAVPASIGPPCTDWRQDSRPHNRSPPDRCLQVDVRRHPLDAEPQVSVFTDRGARSHATRVSTKFRQTPQHVASSGPKGSQKNYFWISGVRVSVRRGGHSVVPVAVEDVSLQVGGLDARHLLL